MFLTDSGLETDLIFSGGWDLPDFAAYPLLDRDDGRAALRRYVNEHVRVARDAGLGIVVETPTWRASSDWGARLGHDAKALTSLNRRGAELVDEARRGVDDVAVVVSGCLGPRGDGYVPGAQMTAQEAADYHRPQIEAFADSRADLVSALTLTGVAEAVGIVEAARAAGLPVVVSFTVAADGRLPDGTPLGDAIARSTTPREAPRRTSWSTARAPRPPRAGRRPCRRPVAAAAGRTRERLPPEPRGARRGAGAGRRRPGRARAAAGGPASARRPVLGGCCGTDVRHIRALAGEIVGH